MWNVWELLRVGRGGWVDSVAENLGLQIMRRLTMGIRSEKCVVKRLRRCTNVIECTCTNLDSVAYNTPRLYGIAYCS